MTKNEIVVNGQRISTEIKEVDIFSLNYWKENPRINAILKQRFTEDCIDDKKIEQALWEKESVKDLYKDIERHKGLIDEILVKDNIVLEGNSRLCAYRHLYKNAFNKNDKEQLEMWKNIRARIIPDTTTDEIVFAILGTWHIKGKTRWDTYEKAAYLKRMKVSYNYSIKEIALSISQTEKFVNDHIEAYELMVENEIFTLDKFSHFYELVKNKKLNKIFDKEPEVKKVVVEKIKENKFTRGEEIRDLHKVLSDKKTKKEFVEGDNSFKEVLNLSKERHPEYKDSFFNNIKKVSKLLHDLDKLKIEEINRELKEDSQKKYIVEEFQKRVNKFIKSIEL